MTKEEVRQRILREKMYWDLEKIESYGKEVKKISPEYGDAIMSRAEEVKFNLGELVRTMEVKGNDKSEVG